MKKRILTTAVYLLIISSVMGRSTVACAQNSKEKFKVVNRTVSLDQQSGAVHLNEVDGVGIVWIKDKTFTKGVIEFEVRGKDKFQGSFVGIAFHGLNGTSYESVYFRPFNFRAKDPVRKSHAVQYIANPKYDWPKLRDDFPGKYEQPVAPELDPNEWFHVKITVAEKWIRVYVNGSTRPVLEVESLLDTPGKMIGYWAGSGSGGDWRNLKL